MCFLAHHPIKALNPAVDWHATEEDYLNSEPSNLVVVDGFLSRTALSVLLDMVSSSTVFFDGRENYIGAYPTDGLSHPLLYQIAEELSERMPRLLGPGSEGWPMIQAWVYIYGGNDGQTCARGIKTHADAAHVNINVWLAPDEANLGRPEDGEGGGLTVFYAKPPEDWEFNDYNKDEDAIRSLLRTSGAGESSISVPHKQNRAFMFDSMLFHKSDPFRFRPG
ncbi:unnamed protein product, partial [Discosporangium mesarthrocarpum]